MTWKLLEQACLDGDLLTVETILAPLSQLSRQYLMQRRAPVTLLHSACSAGHLTVAQLLIAEGADMEAALSDGMTPLHLAYCNKCLDVANMLIKLGADVKAEDAAGKIPFDYRPKQIIRHHLPTKDYREEAPAKRAKRSSAGRSAVKRVTKSQIPNGYKIIVERVAWLSSRSPKAIWSRVIKDVFVTKDAQRLYIRAECAIKLLSKLKTLPDYKAVSLIRQMSHHATTLIQDLCASENLVEHRHTQNGVYQIKSLLGKIAAYRKDLPATSAAVVACEQNVQASSAAVKRAAEQVAEAQKRWAKLHQQHTAKETALCLARREAMEGKQKVIHAADKALRTLDEHREKMQESIDAIYRVSVKAMTTNQVHLLVWRISRQTVSLERIEEHSIDGQLLIELTASDLMEMTGLQPLGLCHRVVHYAKMAADTAQPELLELYYGQYVQALNDWLLEQSDETGNQYAPQLKAQQVDIFTIGSMSVRDLADLQVKPKDRRRMLELAIEASASVTIPLTEAAKSEPQMSVEHQRRLLIEKQALAERLATVEKERDGMERLRRQQQAIADQEEKKHIQVASDFLDEVTRRTELEELLQQQNEQLHCPITMRLMEDPVMAEDGHVYERDAITNWVEKKGTSPMTQVVMGDKLQPVLLIKQLMAQSKEIARRKR